MGSYLFYNDDVCFRTQRGQSEDMPLAAFADHKAELDKDAHILVLGLEGVALFERVRKIRRMFPRDGIKTLVPYPVALRAFLLQEKILPLEGDCIIADDLGEKFLMTAFRGGQAVATRVLSSHDSRQVLEEALRTQKSVLEKDTARTGAGVLRVLSNNPDVVEAARSFGSDGQFLGDLFETRFPAFEVLGRVKFPVMLMPPEDVAAARKQFLRQKFVLACAASILMAAGGGGFCYWAQTGEAAALKQLQQLDAVRVGLENDLQQLNGLTYRSRIRDYPRASLARVFDGFLFDIPPDGRLEWVSMQRKADMTWDLTGMIIFPQQEVLPFVPSASREDLLKVEAQDVFIRGKTGLKVSAMLSVNDESKGVVE